MWGGLVHSGKLIDRVLRDGQTPRTDSQTPRYLPFVRSYPQKQACFIPNINSDILKC